MRARSSESGACLGVAKLEVACRTGVLAADSACALREAAPRPWRTSLAAAGLEWVVAVYSVSGAEGAGVGSGSAACEDAAVGASWVARVSSSSSTADSSSWTRRLR